MKNDEETLFTMQIEVIDSMGIIDVYRCVNNKCRKYSYVAN